MFNLTGFTEFLVIPMMSGENAEVFNYFFSLIFWPGLCGWGFLMIIELVAKSSSMRGGK